MRKYQQHGGWYGNSHGHSLAARGMRMYARKQVLMDPLFYAQKREEQVPFNHLIDLVRNGQSYDDIKRMHPDADPEDLRLRGIKAIEVQEGNNTLSMLNTNGVDLTVRMAQSNDQVCNQIKSTLNNAQQASFLPQVKVDLLKKRLE